MLRSGRGALCGTARRARRSGEEGGVDRQWGKEEGQIPFSVGANEGRGGKHDAHHEPRKCLATQQAGDGGRKDSKQSPARVRGHNGACSRRGCRVEMCPSPPAPTTPPPYGRRAASSAVIGTSADAGTSRLRSADGLPRDESGCTASHTGTCRQPLRSVGGGARERDKSPEGECDVHLEQQNP